MIGLRRASQRAILHKPRRNLLDTNVASYFLQASREKELSDAAKVVPLAIVGEVRDELAADGKRGGPAFAKWLATSGIDVKELLSSTI